MLQERAWSNLGGLEKIGPRKAANMLKRELNADPDRSFKFVVAVSIFLFPIFLIGAVGSEMPEYKQSQAAVQSHMRVLSQVSVHGSRSQWTFSAVPGMHYRQLLQSYSSGRGCSEITEPSRTIVLM